MKWILRGFCTQHLTFQIIKAYLTEEIKQESEKIKSKRKRITEYEAGKLARPGEEWPELLQRIGHEYHVIFEKDKS